VVDVEALGLLAKYPFMPEAKAWVAESGYVLADLVEDPAYERSRQRALDRVTQALEAGVVEDAPLNNDVLAEIELLSYPLARALVAQIGDPYLVNRYAVAESKLAYQRLKDEDSSDLKAIAGPLGLRFEPPASTEMFVRIHFLEYLRNAPTRMAEWKLVNQALEGGYVSLTSTTAVRLMEEALRVRLVDEISDLPKPGPSVAKAFGSRFAQIQMKVAALRARFKDEATGEVRLEAFPPCMNDIWSGIKGHVNIPHMGRFAIVSFLHKLGMDSEAVLEFFSAVPDFDASKSRYQIEHITGKIGGSTEYTPPTCQTMATYGICPLEKRDDLCMQITHPLTYYRRALRRLPVKAKHAPKPPAKEAVDG
jgi:DNA primase large subunit